MQWQHLSKMRTNVCSRKRERDKNFLFNNLHLKTQCRTKFGQTFTHWNRKALCRIFIKRRRKGGGKIFFSIKYCSLCFNVFKCVLTRLQINARRKEFAAAHHLSTISFFLIWQVLILNKSIFRYKLRKKGLRFLFFHHLSYHHRKVRRSLSCCSSTGLYFHFLLGFLRTTSNI